ncbi:MAG: pyridoxamine 5'-phosphate oxidase family protein [Deltaproteobacteria bacterium]|nr:pyridoxamine 5'-phosphate oxidase family protein [Deltaproteobacteria bacterium]
MEIGKHWEMIQKVFRQSLNSSLHYALASVNDDCSPHLTPIGALFLREDKTGFYFDVFSVNMSKNLDKNQRVCVLAVNSHRSYWRECFITGRCEIPPSVRLLGSVGARRKATAEETAMWENHVAFARGMKGYELLWGNMRFVRDIYFDFFEPVNMGEMTEGLW